ncbi:hypothetical protein B9Z55_002770 [Caenorhabditis nigoni]|uniref:SXP/RAL-2 family protein Ani s 5-like cation-binding domain-containing protein n=1 Tax=Caenorhabditis nigoni TaxID=1611254 RepID=A0A2G5VM23_9PELO|nr:hypothetical protein B9Z55_002770 [Caenorhabditis nigoni]
MFKATVILAIVLVAVSANHPKGDEYRAELVAAGLSTQAIDGISKIGETAYVSFGKRVSPSFQDAIQDVTKLFLDVEKFMKTQSEQDQKSYATYVEKKKKELDN